MRCDDFSQRFHEALDSRQSPWNDADLRDHAIECRECEEMLVVWEQVQNCLVMPGHQESPPEAVERTPTISLVTSPATYPNFSVRLSDAFSFARQSLWVGVVMAVSLIFLMLYPGQSQAPPSKPVAQKAHTSVAPTAKVAGESVQLIAWDGYTLDFDQIREQVQKPDWWGSMVVAAWRPVDPLTKGIRPLTESIESALRLLDPRMHLRNDAVQTQAPEDISAGKPELFAQVV